MSPSGTCGAATAAGPGCPSPELSSVPALPRTFRGPRSPLAPAAGEEGTENDFPAASSPGKGMHSSLAESSRVANPGTRREMFAVL